MRLSRTAVACGLAFAVGITVGRGGRAERRAPVPAPPPGTIRITCPTDREPPERGGGWRICNHRLTVTRVLGPTGPWRMVAPPPPGRPVWIIALPDDRTYLAAEEEPAPGS